MDLGIGHVGVAIKQFISIRVLCRADHKRDYWRRSLVQDYQTGTDQFLQRKRKSSLPKDESTVMQRNIDARKRRIGDETMRHDDD
jgi:hypothetical protein